MMLPSLAPEASASAIPPRPRNMKMRGIDTIGGAEDRNRTGTVVSNRRILSPLRLPVPPPRHYHYKSLDWQSKESMERVMGIEPT